jgi:hypothetical protein
MRFNLRTGSARLGQYGRVIGDGLILELAVVEAQPLGDFSAPRCRRPSSMSQVSSTNLTASDHERVACPFADGITEKVSPHPPDADVRRSESS